MLFNCLAFPKVTTFTCSFGAFNVSVSVFNMSFFPPPGQISGVWALVRATERADRHYQSVLTRLAVVLTACRCLLDLSGQINEPTVWVTQQAAKLHFQQMCGKMQQGLFDKPSGAVAKENTLFKQLTPSFFLSSEKSQNCSFISLQLCFLHCARAVCDYSAESSAVLISAIDRHSLYDSSSCSIRRHVTVGKEKWSKVVGLSG